MAENWQPITPLPTEDSPVRRNRPVDYLSLVAGLVFIAVAVVLMTGVDIPWRVFHDGGVLWTLLIIGGIALLAGELRKGRRR